MNDPDKEEDHTGRPGGPGRRLLLECLREAGCGHYSVAFTYAVRCGGSETKDAHARQCKPFLADDLAALQPRLVMPLGAHALKNCVGINKIMEHRGHLKEVDGQKYLPSFSPSFILLEPSRRPALVQDLAQAREILSGEDGKPNPRIEELRKRYSMPLALAELDAICTELENDDIVFLAVDTEFAPGDWLHPDLKCLMLVLTWRRQQGVAIPIDHPESPFLGNQAIKDRLAAIIRKKKLIFHNTEPDAAVLEKCFGIKPWELDVFFDTMYGAICLFGPGSGVGLKPLTYSFADNGGYHLELESYKNKNEVETYDQIPLDILGNPYAAGDGDSTFQIAPKFVNRIRKQDSQLFYYNCLLPGYLLDIEMRKNGMLVDQDELAWRQEWFTTEQDRLYDAADALPTVKRFILEFEAANKKKEFSFMSLPQMSALVFDILGTIPSKIKTDKGAESTKEAAIYEMLLHPDQPKEAREFLTILLQAKKASLAVSNLINPIVNNIWEDGRLHPQWGMRAESGRRRGKNPNPQNITDGRKTPWKGDPDRNPWNLRMLIKARDGYSFISPDFAQLEFRLAACYSKDPTMVADCRPKPHDAHTKRANQFKITRNNAKTVNFGMIYDATASRLQMELFKATHEFWDILVCQQFRDEIRSDYKDLFLLKDAYTKFMKRHGWVATPIFGHRRLLPKAMDLTVRKAPFYDKKAALKAQEAALREGWNHLMQSMGHCLLDMVMVEFYKYIIDNKKPWYLIADQHDGFQCEVPDADIPEAARVADRLMREISEAVLGDWMIVPIEGEISVGKHLGNLKEYKV